jgi:hypothetical protein
MSDYIDWNGTAGSTYRYWFLETPRDGASIQDVGGNYAFVKKLANGNFVPIYFGVADSLKNRMPNHERFDDAIRAGATHVMAHTTLSAVSRDLEEVDLIRQWNPILNEHHRTTG